MVNATPRPLYPWERPSTHCIGGWVGHRAGLDGCGKSRRQRDSIPGPSSPTELPRPLAAGCIFISSPSVRTDCVVTGVQRGCFRRGKPAATSSLRLHGLVLKQNTVSYFCRTAVSWSYWQPVTRCYRYQDAMLCAIQIFRLELLVC